MKTDLSQRVWAVLLSGLAIVLSNAMAEDRGVTQANQTPSARSTSSATAAEQAHRWGLTIEDWTRYETLMQGPRGIWSPNLDPVTALGVHAQSDAERRRYAEILVRLERERTVKELAFERMMQQVKHELFPNDPAFDPVKLEELLLKAHTHDPPFQAGDRLLLFVNLGCRACDALMNPLIREVQSLPGLQLDVFVVGGVKDADIQRWAQKLNLPEALVNAGRLTLNHDNQTLNRLTRDPTLTVPVLIRARSGAYELLPNDPITLTRGSALR